MELACLEVSIESILRKSDSLACTFYIGLAAIQGIIITNSQKITCSTSKVARTSVSLCVFFRSDGKVDELEAVQSFKLSEVSRCLFATFFLGNISSSESSSMPEFHVVFAASVSPSSSISASVLQHQHQA
jgi:hypothetical protein